MTKSSRTKKLVQAAALAAVLVPLGSIAVETSPMTYYNSSGGSSITSNTWFFDGFDFQLTFENLALNSNFTVDVNAMYTNQDAVTGAGSGGGPNRFGNFPGFTCVPIAGASNCIDFEVTAPASGPTTWSGFFDVFVTWFAPTDPAFPNGPGNRIRILHNMGSVEGNGFDTDITDLGSYFAGPPGGGGFDPGLGGRDNNFQSFIVAQAPPERDQVPEPVTLLLVGSGVSGLLYRRRRRKQAPEPPSGA